MSKPTPDGVVTCAWDKKGTAWKSGRHGGIDYRAPIGTPITAIADGTLIYAGRGAGWGASYGIHLIIQHGDLRFVYAHLSSFDPNLIRNKTISEGQQIGLSGATGNCHGPHLHLEARVSPFRYNVDAVDPGPYVGVSAPKAEAPKAEAPKPAPAVKAAENVHTVTKGQTLSGIAKKYGTSVEALAAKNGIADPSKISIGQKIKI
jgi:murein DD-endopeptidase MepM/ murein hydrolase activator NlpD